MPTPSPASASYAARSGLSWQNLQTIAWRRRWWFLVPFFCLWALAFGLSWVLPRRYRSQATLLVERQSVPKAYVQPNVTFDVNVLLQNMAQRILSRGRLEKILRRDHLYPRLQATLGPDAAVRAMRKDISIAPVQLGGLPQSPAHDWTAFSISYTGASPAQARQVATQLTSSFIEENLRVTQQASDRTTSFLSEQLQQAEKSVARDQQRIQRFESQNLGALPGQGQANLAVVLNLQSQLGDAQGALTRSQRQIAYDQNLLKQQRNWAAAAPLQQRLDQLRLHLANLRSRYTEQYPSIPHVEAEILHVKKRLAKLNSTPTTAATSSESLAGMPNRAQISSQLQAEQMIEVREQRQVAKLRQALQQYQGRLNLEPVRAQALASLENAYQQDQANVTALLLRFNNSQLASQLEQSQGGTQFRLVDPPNLPRKPSWPKPLQFSGFGLLGGLALGLAVAAAIELRQDQVHSSQELSEFGLPPILSRIPPLRSPADLFRNRLLRGVEGVVVCLMLGVIIAGNYLVLRH